MTNTLAYCDEYLITAVKRFAQDCHLLLVSKNKLERFINCAANFFKSTGAGDNTPILIMTLLLMTMLITLNMGDNTYNGITYNDFKYNEITYNT